MATFYHVLKILRLLIHETSMEKKKTKKTEPKLLIYVGFNWLLVVDDDAFLRELN